MSNKKIFRITTTIIIILLIAGMIFYPKLKPLFMSGENKGMPGGPGGAGRGQQILLASGYVIVPTQLREQIYSTGSLLPDEEVELSFETSGKVVAIYFKEGTRVKKGELLAKINDKPCLLYTSDAADERSSVDLGGRRIIKKKKTEHECNTITQSI